MSARVYTSLRPASAASILSGRAVRSPAWSSVVQLANTVLGRGSVLVPAFYPGSEFSSGTQHVFRFRVRPRYQASDLVWVLFVVGNELTIEAPVGGTSIDIPVTGSVLLGLNKVEVMHSRTQSSDETEITIGIQSDDDFEVTSLACYELPRPSLSTSGDDLGVDEERVQAEDPILADSGASDVRLKRIADAITGDIGRRVGHFMWSATDDEAEAISVTSTTSTIFALNTSLIGRALDLDNTLSEAETTSRLACRVRAKLGAGTSSAQWSLSMTSGDSGSISITSSTWAWHPDTGSDPMFIDVDSEDVTSSDGRRSTRWDEAQQTLEAAGGAVRLGAVCVWEDT